MARGRAATYDAQRELILERAAELFATRGYAGTSMNEVAAACTMSKATLYHYYRDKDALLVHIAEGHVLHLRTLLGEAMALELSPPQRLQALIHRFVQAYAGARHAHRVLTEDVKYLNEADRQRVLGIERELVHDIASVVAQVRPDVASAHLAKPLTMLLFGMINWMFTWMRPEGHLTHEDMAPLVAELFMGGLQQLQQRPQPDQERHAA